MQKSCCTTVFALQKRMVIAQNEIFRTVVENGKYGDPVDTMKSSPRSSDALQASDGSWVSIRTAFTQEQVTVQEYTRVQITFFVIYTDQMATNIDQMLDFIGIVDGSAKSLSGRPTRMLVTFLLVKLRNGHPLIQTPICTHRSIRITSPLILPPQLRYRKSPTRKHSSATRMFHFSMR